MHTTVNLFPTKTEEKGKVCHRDVVGMEMLRPDNPGPVILTSSVLEETRRSGHVTD